jgi:two-component system, OmpR family, phosphate regulon sensor histidine kinase PhoR
VSRFSRIADSYRARLILGYVLVAAVFALAWGWSLYGPLQQTALRQQQRNLTAVAQAASLYTAETTATPADIVTHLSAGTDIRVTIVAADGRVLADTENDPKTMDNHAGRPEIAAALAGRAGSNRRTSATEGTQQLYVAVPATLDGHKVALRVSQSLDNIDSIARTSRQVGLVLLVAALLIAVGIATWASGAASRPIQELSTVAERMAGGNLSVDIPEVPADLEALAVSLETLRRQMRSRLDALEAEQRTLRTALDGLSDAVFLLEGDKIRFANDAASRLFRAPGAGWRGIAIDAAGLPASLSSAICDRLSAARAYAAELEPDPLGTTLRLVVLPLEPSAENPRTLAVISDVTDRARLERVRRDFVANASHELKTPVAGIQLLAESAETAAEDGDITQSLEFTRQIEAEAARLKRLVTDLLDLSRLESAPAPDAITDVRQAVDNAIAGHRGAAGRHELALSVDLSAIRGVDVFVAAEPTDVAVALDNLLDNALAYTEIGSVSVSVKASATSVRIKVTDTGVGIAPEHLGRVFERFYRIDRARSRDSGGTGLGLALVRHVAERSGGSVTVASELGVGSTFTLTLPRAL